MIQFIKNFLARREQSRRDYDFRTGLLYSLDRELFPDGKPLLNDSDRDRLLEYSAPFSAGLIWGTAIAENTTGSTKMMVERARRATTLP